MQNLKIKKRNPGLVGFWFREYSVSWVVLLGGSFSGCFFGAGKIGGNFNLSVSNGGCFLLVSNTHIWLAQTSSWHCAKRAVMFCRFGANKVKTQIQKQGQA